MTSGNSSRPHEVEHELARLVGLVGRAFYEPKHALVLVAMTKATQQTKESLHAATGLEKKDLKMILDRLERDRLLRCDVRLEKRENRNETIKQYFLDYRLFVDAVSYRILHMEKSLRKTTETSQLSSNYYHCPTCDRNFEVLEALQYMNPQTSMFECDVCQGPLVERRKEELSSDDGPNLSKLMTQIKPVTDLLQRIEPFEIPSRHTLNETAAGRTRGKMMGGAGVGGANPASLTVQLGDAAAANAAQEQQKPRPAIPWLQSETDANPAADDAKKKTAGAAVGALAGVDLLRASTEPPLIVVKSKPSTPVSAAQLLTEQLLQREAAQRTSSFLSVVGTEPATKRVRLVERQESMISTTTTTTTMVTEEEAEKEEEAQEEVEEEEEEEEEEEQFVEA